MAKQYIVKATIHGQAKKGGKKVVLKPATTPQDVPAELVKELLDRDLIEEIGGKPAAASDPAGGTDGSGDDNSGA